MSRPRVSTLSTLMVLAGGFAALGVWTNNAGNTFADEASEAKLLEALKRAAEPIDFRALKIRSQEQALTESSSRVDKAKAFLEQFPAGSAKLTEARLLALKPMLFHTQLSHKAADRDALAGLVKAVKATPGLTAEQAAEADLALISADFSVMLDGVDSAAAFKAVLDKNADGLAKRLSELLVEHKNNPAVKELFTSLRETFDNYGAQTAASAMLETLKQVDPENPVIKAAALGPIQTLKVGEAVDFRFQPVGSDKVLALADLKGKVVVIDFWATWCPPCRAEMPKMKTLYAKYKKQGVEFIGISLDRDEAALTNYCQTNEISWPQCFGTRAQKLANACGVQGIPTLYIIDKTGKLHSAEARGKLEMLIPELLNK